MLTPLEAEMLAALRAVAAAVDDCDLATRKAVMLAIRGPMGKAQRLAEARNPRELCHAR